jgi:hypothetical protein
MMPVADQVMLVTTGLALGIDIVTQRRAAMVDPFAQDGDDRLVQRCGLSTSDPAQARVDSGSEAGLVGIDVPDAGDGPLAEELSLQLAPTGPEGSVEVFGGELVAERLRADLGEDPLVFSVVSDADPAEPADVAEAQHRRVIEGPPGSQVGVVEVGAGDELAGHAEVDDQLAVVIEIDEQELAPPAECLDGGGNGFHRGGEFGRGVAAGGDDATAHQAWFELAADGLDLGQLWHGVTIASGPVSDGSAFDDIIAAAAVLGDIDDVARVEAWGSSALSVWRESESASDIDIELVDWLVGRGDQRAALVLLSIADALGLDETVRSPARACLDPAPGWVDHIGSAEPTRAWEIADGDERSIGIGFAHSDGSEMSLLADIDSEGLAALVVAPGPEELFAEAEDVVAPLHLDLTDSATAIVEAWRRGRDRKAAVSETVMVNHMVALRRLGQVLGEPLDDLLHITDPPAEQDGLTSSERSDLDAWAIATLDSAIGRSADGEISVDAELVDPFTVGGRAGYPAEEREAFSALEWADWLGAVIGLVRAGPGVDCSASALVDHVNRCPEITSTVPKKDRPYYEWAWQHVVLLWQRHDLVDDERRLTEFGAQTLPKLLARAWRPQ